MSRTEIDNLICDIKIACIKHSQEAQIKVYPAISWYIESGRASLEWIRLLQDIKHYKGMITIALKGDTSTSGIIRSINKRLNYIVEA